MRIEPKTAGAIAAGAFFFLLVFGIGWPGPGTWLLVFALLFIAVGAAAWWLDGAIVQQAQMGGAVAAGAGGSPFRSAGRAAPRGRRGDSMLLTLGLPGPDGAGRWVLPNNVHVTLVAAAVGLLAMVIFVGGALGGGGSTPAPLADSSAGTPAIDFNQPITPAESSPIVTEAVTPSAGLDSAEPSPIVIDTPSATRPEIPRPASPIEAVGTATEPANTVVHTVVSGDTIYDLAISYGSSIEAIMNANGISEFDTIRVDDQLLVPVLG